jgi:hypothetical protein
MGETLRNSGGRGAPASVQLLLLRTPQKIEEYHILGYNAVSKEHIASIFRGEEIRSVRNQ